MLDSEQWPYEAAAIAFEAIPRTLAQNCGVNVIRKMTELQGKVIYFYYICSGEISQLWSVLIHMFDLFQHANGENAWIGIDGNTGDITDMKERKV